MTRRNNLLLNVLFLGTTTLLLVLPQSIDAFTPVLIGGFNFKFPWDNDESSSDSSSSSAALQPGDTIAVIGASGNVGKLVALRLSDTYKVNGVVRSTSPELEEFFEGRDNPITLYESDLLEELENGGGTTLAPALQSANAIIICTGTTAFPTEAWSKSGEFSVTDEVIQALLSNRFSVKAAIQDLDALGLNTPNNVDDRANALVLDTWESVGKARKKRVILLSSIGVQRRTAMPFPILNACGVLDAKAAAEEGLIATAERLGFSYTIVRPGQLFGGPYDNNYYLGTLFQLDKDAKTQDVDVGRGDELLGDTLRSTLAEVTAMVCEGDCARDMDFAAVNVKGDVPTAEEVQERLQAL